MIHRPQTSKSFILVLSALLVFWPGATLAADLIEGTWTGTVDQPGSGSYSATMTFTSAGSGSSNYPSLNCGGNLSGGGSGGVYRFAETITSGRATAEQGGCIDGQISITVQGDWMVWEWSGSWQGEYYTASAKLRRTGGSASGRSCEECGRALLRDIGVGLQRSQGLRNYVGEARQNYANCTSGLPEKCINACARYMLQDQLPACNKWDVETAYRACVETTHRGATVQCE